MLSYLKQLLGLSGTGVHSFLSSAVWSFIIGGVRWRKLLILTASSLPVGELVSVNYSIHTDLISWRGRKYADYALCSGYGYSY